MCKDSAATSSCAALVIVATMCTNLSVQWEHPCNELLHSHPESCCRVTFAGVKRHFGCIFKDADGKTMHLWHQFGREYLENYLEGYKYRCFQQVSPDGKLMNDFCFSFPYLFLVFLWGMCCTLITIGISTKWNPLCRLMFLQTVGQLQKRTNSTVL